jgi:hypothetical protein
MHQKEWWKFGVRVIYRKNIVLQYTHYVLFCDKIMMCYILSDEGMDLSLKTELGLCQVDASHM